MRFRINYSGEYQDSIDISGETIDEIKESAIAECKKEAGKQKIVGAKSWKINKYYVKGLCK